MARETFPRKAAKALKTKARKVFIRTYGCQMNVYDSDRMADLLAADGYGPAASPEGADLVLLNTCHIREKAAEKVYSELGRLRLLKDGGAGRRPGGENRRGGVRGAGRRRGDSEAGAGS